VRQGEATLFGSMLGLWRVSRDADPVARMIHHRHYSRRIYRDGRDPKKFVGPGENLVLIGWDDRALFVWRKFISMDHQAGVNCAVFRNESDALSSHMILEAETFAHARWPGEARFYTYVNPREVRSSNPGYCFLMAGWHRCGVTKGGLVVLEKFCAAGGL